MLRISHVLSHPNFPQNPHDRSAKSPALGIREPLSREVTSPDHTGFDAELKTRFQKQNFSFVFYNLAPHALKHCTTEPLELANMRVQDKKFY